MKNSWWWTGELSETCTVLFRKEIWEISATSWFYYKNLSRCTVTWTSNLVIISTTLVLLLKVVWSHGQWISKSKLLYNLALSHSVCLCVKPLFELGPDLDLQILTFRIFALFLGLMHIMCVYAYWYIPWMAAVRSTELKLLVDKSFSLSFFRIGMRVVVLLDRFFPWFSPHRLDPPCV